MSIESQHASIKTEKNKKFKINARKEKKKGYKKNPSFMIKKSGPFSLINMLSCFSLNVDNYICILEKKIVAEFEGKTVVLGIGSSALL